LQTFNAADAIDGNAPNKIVKHEKTQKKQIVLAFMVFCNPSVMGKNPPLAKGE
jgi:hypothetical protein